MIFKLDIVLLWLLLFLRIDYVRAAGVAVHLNIASRVKLSLPGSLKGFEREYYAGSFHPDAFYNCFGLSLAAENAHWPPFLKAAVEYHVEHYALKGLENKSLKAFIYGVFTHQVADVSWHSLHSYQGLMRMIAEVEFDGNFQTAHDYLDTNGDFIQLNREFENLSDADFSALVQFYKKEWVYPTHDIVEIYHSLGFQEITKAKMELCMDRGFSALQGEVMAVLADRATNHRLSLNLQNSPLTFILLNNYYYGGIDQITNTLAICLKELDGWFSATVIPESWNICQPVFKKHPIENQGLEHTPRNLISRFPSKLRRSLHPHSDNLYLSSGIHNSQFGTSIKVGNYLGEPTIAISAPYEDFYGTVYLVPLREILHGDKEIERELRMDGTKLVSSRWPLSSSDSLHDFPSRFGDELFTWKLNGHEFLVVSEPGLTQFKLFLFGSLVAVLELSSAETVLGRSGVKEWTILSRIPHDLNGDGWPELVLGSMFSDDCNLKFQGGLVVILDGKKFYSSFCKELRFSLGTEVPVININSIILQTYETPEVLRQSNQYEQFGVSFATTKALVLIGINSIGGVVVFDKNSGVFLGLLSNEGQGFFTTDFPKRRASEKTSLYAFNGILTGNLNGTEWVIVSGAGYSFDSICPLCGLAYLYKLEYGNFELVTKLTAEVTGKNENFVLSLFSSSMVKISDSLVVIGSSSFNDGRGALFEIHLEELLDQNNKIEEYTINHPFFIADSGIGFTNFAYDSIEYFHYEDHTYIAVSLANHFYSQFVHDGKKFSGSVLIVKL
ncbi:hypothetical protein PMKS-003094 [Pichia membranifaciens]|uniref:Phospholipase C/D domain-containing protein n=1 Tax=Pichia membranifaciens TaxID=4926 RepID=A0A1Q2YJP1_9ASCO|nr:hypothetical protein PMKS-003094 [Pichia membranifaciens]